MRDQNIKEILIEKNVEFKGLFLQHQEYEERLRSIANKRPKNDLEVLEEQKIKKQKLRLKDAMQRQIVDFKKNLAAW